MPAKMQRKVLQSGNSKVAALSPDWLRMFKINLGDSVDVIYNSIVIIKPRGFELDPDFLREEFNLILKIESKKAAP